MSSPLAGILVGEHISRESFELLNLIPNTILLVLNLLGTTSYCSKIGSKNGEELLVDDACSLNVFEDLIHVDWLCKDFLCLAEVPPFLLGLDVSLGVVKLLLPFHKHSFTQSYDLDCILWLLSEDALNVNLRLYFVANFM